MKKLLAIRNDRLGDLILTLPALRIIKKSIPDIQVDCLVDSKYIEISELSNDIDNIITENNLMNCLSNKNYDFCISFFSTFRIGYKLWQAHIESRYAPATKIAQFFYNKTIKQKRSQSLKPEYEYNNDLAEFFLKDNGYIDNSMDEPLIEINNNEKYKNQSQKIIYIHPFTGGSSKTLSENDFTRLCYELDKLCNCKFILHCDDIDYKKCEIIRNKNSNLDISTINPTSSLKEMFLNISKCDLFIAGSTGPLHVAASMNKKTVGFYPSKTSSSSLRWDTINDDSIKLCFSDSDDNKDLENINIDIERTAKSIYEKLLS